MGELHQISGCENPARKADVLFIHGLGGDAFATWRFGRDDSTSWPHWLGEEFPDVGVWSLGYAASPTRWARLLGLLRCAPFLRGLASGSRDSGFSMALPRRATQVLDRMLQNGFGARPILFVCHSLGGLLAKQLLRRAAEATDQGAKSVCCRTRAVLFLATPHAGAMLASLVNAFNTVFRASVSLEDLRAHDAHLEDLYNWYRNHAEDLGIQTRSYYEQRALGGVTIVNPTSANPGVGDDPVPLDEDHLSIAKPRSRDAQVCGALRSLLRNHILPARPVGASDAEALSPKAAAGGSGVSAVQAFQEGVVAVQQSFSEAESVLHPTTILRIGQVGSMQVGTDGAAGVAALKHQLTKKDEQISQKDVQITALHKILENVIGNAVGTTSGEIAQGGVVARVPAKPPACSSQRADESCEEKADEWIRMFEDCLDLDFPRACEEAPKLEAWVESNVGGLSQGKLIRLYHLLFRVEIGRIHRGTPGCDLSKAELFLKKAGDGIG